jgi:hypothetical protein
VFRGGAKRFDAHAFQRRDNGGVAKEDEFMTALAQAQRDSKQRLQIATGSSRGQDEDLLHGLASQQLCLDRCLRYVVAVQHRFDGWISLV